MRKSIGVLLACTLALGACGGDETDPSANPKQALIEAFEALTEGEGTEVTLSLDSDLETIKAAQSNDPDPPPDDYIETLLDAELRIAANSETDPAKAQSETELIVGGDSLAEVIQQGYELYVRADVEGVMETFQIDPSKLEAAIAKLPPGLDFVEQAIAGEWIHLTGLEQLAAMSGAASGGTGQFAQQQKEFLKMLERSLTSSEVREGSEDGPGTNIEAQINLKALMDEVLAHAQRSGQVPPGQMPTAEQLASMPDEDAVIDAWVEDGRLTQISFDVMENKDLLGEITENLPDDGQMEVVMGLAEFDGEVEPPDDAVEVSFQQILSAMMSGSFGSQGSTGTQTPAPQGDPCKEIAELPAEQQEPFKDICPELGN